MTTARLDLSQNGLAALPASIPPQLIEERGALVKRTGWKHAVAREIIPGYAQSQDCKVTNYFLNFFKEIITEKRTVSSEPLKKVIRFAEQHLAERESYRKYFNLSSASREMGDLQRYLFVAKTQTNDFQSPDQKAALKENVKQNNKALYAKWDAQQFESRPSDKEIFWTHPDLVDFIFQNHLHRYIRHKDYNHHIEVHPSVRLRNGIWVVEQEPYLKVNGQIKRWSDIRAMLKVDKRSKRLYEQLPDGSKKYWMYLDEGFVVHDRHDMEHMRPFKKLERPPLSCKVQLITSQAPKGKQGITDSFLKGTRHTFFRIIIGKNFQRNHPNLPYKDGEVYSIGWGGTAADANMCQPLASLRGRVYSPDSYEFLAEDLYITELDATDEKVVRLFDVVKQRGVDERAFHIIGGNCCTNAMGMLREAEILDIPTKRHMLGMLYEFIFPDYIRRPIDGFGQFLVNWTPEFIQEGVKNLVLFFYSLAFAPLFTLLGAWRVNITYEPETQVSAEEGSPREGMLRVGNNVKALFSNIFDLFDPDKMTFDMTLSVWQWQLKYGQEYPGKTTFVKQT